MTELPLPKHRAAKKKNENHLLNILLTQFVTYSSNAVTVLVTAGFLGPSGRGRVAFVVSASTLLAIAAGSSLYITAVRLHYNDHPHSIGRGFALTVRIGLVVCLSLLGMAAVAHHHSWHLFNGTALLYVGFGSFATLMSTYLSRICQGLGLTTAYRQAMFIQSVMSVSLGCIAAAAFRSPALVLGAWVASNLAAAAYVIARTSIDLSVGSGDKAYRKLLLSAGPTHIGLCGQQLAYRSDTVLLGVLSTSTAVGRYSVAVPIAEVLWIISESVSLRAFAVEAGVRGQSPAIARLIRMSVAWTGAAGVGVTLAAAFILPKWLPGYGRIWIIVALLMPGMLAQGYARISLSRLIARGSARAVVTLGLVSGILVAIYVPAILAWDVYGAAVGSTCIYLVQAICAYLLWRRSTKVQL